MDLRRSRILLVLAASVLFGLYFWYFSALGKAEVVETPGAYEPVLVPSLVVTPIADSLVVKEYRFDWQTGEVLPDALGRIIREGERYYYQALRFKQSISVHPQHKTLIFEEIERGETDLRQEELLWIELDLIVAHDPLQEVETSRVLEAVFGKVAFRGELDLYDEIPPADRDASRLVYRGRLYRGAGF